MLKLLATDGPLKSIAKPINDAVEWITGSSGKQKEDGAEGNVKDGGNDGAQKDAGENVEKGEHCSAGNQSWGLCRGRQWRPRSSTCVVELRK